MTQIKDKILSLAKQLIAIKSDPGNMPELQEALDLVLHELQGYSIEVFARNGYKSALIYNRPTRPEKFKLILNGHLDVIPGKDYQYTPKVEGDKLIGVGAMDMKANLVCILMAFKEMADKVDYPLALQIVTDEEIGGFDGTKLQIEEGVRADFVIASEPTNFDIVNEAKGVLQVEIVAKGETAHGAYTWKGKNAIYTMNQFLTKLYNKYPIPQSAHGNTTINLASIQTSNQSLNKVPDDCSIQLDIRFDPESRESILNDMQDLIKDSTDTLELKVINNEPCLNVPESNPYLVSLKESAQKVYGKEVKYYRANGSSDSRHYARVGNAGVEFGPIGDGIGTDNEWVSISSLETYYHILLDFMEKIENVN